MSVQIRHHWSAFWIWSVTFQFASLASWYPHENHQNACFGHQISDLIRCYIYVLDAIHLTPKAAVIDNANYILADVQLRANVVDRGTSFHEPVSNANWQSTKEYTEACLHNNKMTSLAQEPSQGESPLRCVFRSSGVRGIRFCHAGTAT